MQWPKNEEDKQWATKYNNVDLFIWKYVLKA
jgi:hypothetical protein